MILRSLDHPEGVSYPSSSSHQVECPLISRALTQLNAFREHNEIRIQTSGSTGSPKTITWPYELVEWSVQSTKKALQLRSDERAVCCLPIEKTGGLMLLLRGYFLNWDVFLLTPSSNPFQNFNISKPYQFISLVPMQLSAILASPLREQLAHFKHVLLGGAHIPSGLSELLSQGSWNSTRFWHGYGMTETASHIALREIKKDLRHEGFNILPDVEIKSDNKDRVSILLPSFNNWLETTDLGRVEENAFYYLGRMDSTVNSGGVKINMLQIERQIESLNLFPTGSFYVYKEADDVLGEKLIVILDAHVEWDVENWNILAQKLNKLEIPKSVYKAPKFFLHDSQKLNRKKTFEHAKLVEVRGQLKP